MMSLKESALREVLREISRVKGIIKVKVLGRKEIDEVLRLEQEAEKRVIMGLVRGINLGIREALKREIVVAALTTMEFKWPEHGTIQMRYQGEVLGEEVLDPWEMKRLEAEGHWVMNGFVIYRDVIEKVGRDKLKDIIVTIAPLPLPQLKIPRVKDLVVGSPSLPTDLYIKKIIGASQREEGIGSVVIGFNLRAR